MGAPDMQPARHAAAPALRNAARAHASVLMVLTPGADGTPGRAAIPGHRPRRRDQTACGARAPCLTPPLLLYVPSLASSLRPVPASIQPDGRRAMTEATPCFGVLGAFVAFVDDHKRCVRPRWGLRPGTRVDGVLVRRPDRPSGQGDGSGDLTTPT